MHYDYQPGDGWFLFWKFLAVPLGVGITIGISLAIKAVFGLNGLDSIKAGVGVFVGFGVCCLVAAPFVNSYLKKKEAEKESAGYRR